MALLKQFIAGAAEGAMQSFAEQIEAQRRLALENARQAGADRRLTKELGAQDKRLDKTIAADDRRQDKAHERTKDSFETVEDPQGGLLSRNKQTGEMRSIRSPIKPKTTYENLYDDDGSFLGQRSSEGKLDIPSNGLAPTRAQIEPSSRGPDNRVQQVLSANPGWDEAKARAYLQHIGQW